MFPNRWETTSGRPRTVRTTAIIHQVEDMPLSQWGKPDMQNCVLCVCGILIKHFTPYFFIFSQRFDQILILKAKNPSLKQRTYWRHSYIINSKTM